MKIFVALLNLLLLPFYLLEKVVIDLDSQWSWFPLAILRGNQLCLQNRPEVIYSTGGPASAHLAAAIIARRHNLPWIAEFQDPLVHNDWLRSQRALRVFRWLERFICSKADAVIFLTDCARERASQRTDLGQRGWTIYPGATPLAIPEAVYTRGPFCRFAHFGSLGGSRNLKVFLEALQILIKERPALAEVIRLDLYGSCDSISKHLIEVFPVRHMIHDNGRIPRHDSLVAMKRCDVLLLIQNTEEFSSETIPSKTYEYMQIGRPILGLVHKNPELEKILLSMNHLVASANNPFSVKKCIERFVDMWSLCDNLHSQNISPFTISSAVHKLLKVRDCIGARYD